MLTLGRKLHESIIITDTRTGERVGVLKPCEIGNKRIKLAFDFPAHFKILREEIVTNEQPQAEKEAA